VDHREAVAAEPLELVAVDDVFPTAGGEEQARVDVAAGGGAGADQRHQRRDARASGDEQQRPALRRLPDEVAADRAAELDPVARPELVRQEGRDLAVLETLDGQLDAGAIGHRCDRIGPPTTVRSRAGGGAGGGVMGGITARPFAPIQAVRASVKLSSPSCP
jgi:hypothetical protein